MVSHLAISIRVAARSNRHMSAAREGRGRKSS
jgi:hypothetical protein